MAWHKVAGAVYWAALASIALLPAAQGLAVPKESGMKEERLENVREGAPIFWRDFAKGQPASLVRVAEEGGSKNAYGADAPASFWGVRHPAWTPALLNAIGTPPDLTLDPGIRETCDIYLGLRAVEPSMSLAIKLASERDFTTITTPAAAPDRHFDWEFHWKRQVPLAGEKIVVRALGKPFYLQYLKFVPHEKNTVTARVPEQHVTILKEKGRHFAFPGVAQLPNGELVAACREGDAHVCARGRIVLTRSGDGGKTWSPRRTICDTPSDDRDPALLCLPDGALLVSWHTWDSWRSDPALCRKYAAETARMEREGWGKYTGAWLKVSRDGGKSWSEPRKAPVFSPHGPVLGPDGAIYWVGHETRDNTTVVAIYRSADQGQQWTRFSEVAYCPPLSFPLTGEYWDEPNLIFLPDGKAIVTIRVEADGYVRQSYSTDGGKTWSWPRKLPVWGYPQQLCRLPDGRLLMGYGYRRAPLGIRACISRDNGQSWDLEHEIVYRHAGGSSDLGYPYTIPLNDGRVFTVYYYNDQGECYIEGACYRP